MLLGELAAVLLERMAFCRELGKGRENRRWLWLRRKSDGKGAMEVFALCFQEGLDAALVMGVEITPFLAAAAFGKFPGEGLGKLEPPAELAAAVTFLEADCLFVRIVIPGEVFHLGHLLLLPICAELVCSALCTCGAVPRAVCASVFLGVGLFVRIYLFIFMGVHIYASIPETFGEAGIRGGGVGCLPDS